MSTIVPFLTLLIGCGPSGPLFVNIQDVEVQLHGANGLQRRHLDGPSLEQASACLDATVEVDQAATESRQLLQKTYLLLIKDNSGVRNFEMITDHHLKGNGERYYENLCIHAIVEG